MVARTSGVESGEWIGSAWSIRADERLAVAIWYRQCTAAGAIEISSERRSARDARAGACGLAQRGPRSDAAATEPTRPRTNAAPLPNNGPDARRPDDRPRGQS